MPGGGRKVGYKCPPTQHQWKKGQSGNPSGSRRQKRPLAADQPVLGHFSDLLAEKVEVRTQGGRLQKLPLGRAFAMKMLHELMAAPLKEKLEGLKALERLGVFKLQEVRSTGMDDEPIFSEEDRRLLALIAQGAGPER